MIKNIGRNKWQVVIEGKTPEGKRTRQKKVVNGTKDDAVKFLAERNAQISRVGGIIDSTKVTMKEYLHNWLDNVKALEVEKSTLESYRWVIQTYIIPVLGEIPVSKLDTVKVQHFYSLLLGLSVNKETKATNPAKKALSPRTVRYTHSILAQAMNNAVKWNLIHYNPVKLATLPKKHKPESAWMTKEESKKLWEAAKGERLELLFKLLLFSGMRPGEALGLTWDKVNLERGTITITNSLSRPMNHEWILKSTKNDQSRRTIPLSDELIKAFQCHKSNQNDLRLSLGEQYYTEHDFVFATGNGQPLEHRNVVNQYFKPLLKKAGLRNLKLYALRHTNATLLLESGLDIKTISDRLGHKDIQLTLDTYAHVTQGMQQQATKEMEKIFK